MDYQLTVGAIKNILSGELVEKPILQILKNKVTCEEKKPYRVFISDSAYYTNRAMVASHLYPLLSRGMIEFSIVKINMYTTSNVKTPENQYVRIIILLDFEVLKDGAEIAMIGNPEFYVPEPTHLNSSKESSLQPEEQQIHPVQNDISPFITKNSSKRILPIKCISPFLNNWTIQCRVTAKSPIIPWKNDKGEGIRFNVLFLDETGEIWATAFQDQVSQLYDVLQEGRVFYISNCRVKTAYNKSCSYPHEYELSFSSVTEVIPCDEDVSSIPQYHFNFRSLDSINAADPGAILDIIGVCKSTNDVVILTTKTTKREVKKREVILVDTSLTAVVLTLWDIHAEQFVADSSSVVAVKGVRVSEFRGVKSISLVTKSVLKINPDIPEAHSLKEWFHGLPADAKFNTILTGGQKTYLLSEAINAKLGFGDKEDYFTAYCRILHVETGSCLYKACPTSACRKKVVEQNNGLYKCVKCNRDFDHFKNCLLLSAYVADFTGHQLITIFQGVAEELLGVKAHDVARWQEENNDRFCNVFKDLYFHPFLFTFRAQMETFNGESRLKLTAISVKKPVYKDRCLFLISKIKELSGHKLID